MRKSYRIYKVYTKSPEKSRDFDWIQSFNSYQLTVLSCQLQEVLNKPNTS